MQIKVDLKIFIFILIFIITKQIEIYGWLMLFALIHEFGHMLVGILTGLKLKSLHINSFGISIFFESFEEKKIIEIKKIFISLAGPMVNIIFIIVSNFLNINFEIKQTIIYSNTLIAIFNLLPIYPLDGARILKSILNIKYNNKISEKIINKTSNITVVILSIITSFCIIYLRNFVLIFVIGYLWLIVIKENKRYSLKKKIYKIIETNKTF